MLKFIIAVEVLLLFPFNIFIIYVTKKYDSYFDGDQFYKLLAVGNTICLSYLAVFYGVKRGSAFLSISHRGYFNFLILTPCRDEKKLICGRISLSWPDFVVLFVVMLPAFILPIIHILLPLMAFLGIYLASVCMGLFMSEDKNYYVCPILFLFLAPLLVYPFKSINVAFLILLGFYVVAMFDVKKFFSNFPWNTKYWTGDQIKLWRKEAFTKKVVQWPFGELCTEDKETNSPVGYLLICGIVFWWLHIFVWLIEEDLTEYLFVYYVLICVLAFIRLGAYASWGCPPMTSLWGRIWTGHFIIPGYDKVFVAPLLVLLVGITSPIILEELGLPVILSHEIMLCVSLFLACSLPPSTRTWKYTGHYQMIHRINRTKQTGRSKTFNR